MSLLSKCRRWSIAGQWMTQIKAQCGASLWSLTCHIPWVKANCITNCSLPGMIGNSAISFFCLHFFMVKLCSLRKDLASSGVSDNRGNVPMCNLIQKQNNILIDLAFWLHFTNVPNENLFLRMGIWLTIIIDSDMASENKHCLPTG